MSDRKPLTVGLMLVVAACLTVEANAAPAGGPPGQGGGVPPGAPFQALQNQIDDLQNQIDTLLDAHHQELQFSVDPGGSAPFALPKVQSPVRIEVTVTFMDGGTPSPSAIMYAVVNQDPVSEAMTWIGTNSDGTRGASTSAGGTIVINEIMQNPAAVADASGEWFEVYNAAPTPIDINGWTIRDNDIDSHVISNGGPLLVPAGGFLVLGNNADMGTNGGVSVGYSYDGDIFLANGADEVVLLDTALNEVDRVEYDGGPLFPDPNGASMALRSPGLDNNVGANWCESTTSFGAGDLGTPGAANDCSSTTGIGSPIATICNGACPAWIARLLVDDLAQGTVQILQSAATPSTGHYIVHLWY